MCERLTERSAGNSALRVTDYPSQVDRGSGFPGILNVKIVKSPIGILLLLGPLLVAEIQERLIFHCLRTV